LRGTRRWPAIALLTLIALGAGWYGMHQAGDGRGQFAAGDGRLPAFTLPDLDGKPRRHDEWLGKVLVINFWATWCPPCRAEMPTFIDFQQHYGGQGVQFVGIAMDDPEAVRDFARVYGINFPILLGGQDGSELARALGNRFGSLPYSVLFDREGKITYAEAGLFTAEALEAELRPLL
jgi:thiol-disulfide isomerase/thioredoxin